MTRFISSGDMIMQTSIAHLMIIRVLKDGKTSNLRISLKAHVLTRNYRSLFQLNIE